MSLTILDIKKTVLIALASDDHLMETLVLKGGNAIDLLQLQTQGRLSRASYDFDFSMENDFDEDLGEVSTRIERTLTRTFEENGLIVFDYKFVQRPVVISEAVKDFWGGYNVEFKLTTVTNYLAARGNMDKLRREALAVLPSGSPKIELEISKFEYIADKMETQVDGYKIFVYSAEMIVFEKVRAICQQLPSYAAIVPSHSERPRARDFYDIHLIMSQRHIDPGTIWNKQLLTHIFLAKKVPLGFIKEIGGHLDGHRRDWPNVVATLSAKDGVQDFDFYARFVVRQFQPLTFP